MKFQATIEQAGKTATGIVVPREVVEALGSGRRPRVRVTIRNYTYRSTVTPMGGRFMLPSARRYGGAPAWPVATPSRCSSTRTPSRAR
jgi:hypothetical protein